MYHQLLYSASVYLNTGMIGVRQPKIHQQAGNTDRGEKINKVYRNNALQNKLAVASQVQW